MPHDRHITLNASAERLPIAPRGYRLLQIAFRTCPGSDLLLRAVRDVSTPFDEFGMPRDVWFVVRCTRLPDRMLRLYRGTHSLKNLVRRYGFLDGNGCVHHRDIRLLYVPIKDGPRFETVTVPSHLRDATGVPQFYANSGVCWFAALCTVSFADPVVAAFLRRHLPANLHELCDACLRSPDCAEKLRKELWHRFAIGDDVTQPPEMDGCNGFTEFTLLCAKCKIPLLRYHEQEGTLRPMASELQDKRHRPVRWSPPDLAKSHLMVLRFQDGDHQRFPIRRRILHCDRRYRFVGCYGGQRKCGHQIGIASTTGSWRDMVIGDADLHKDGIGPIFVRFDGDHWTDGWWDCWRELVPVTKFGPNTREFCNLNPHNEPDDALDKYRGRRGKNSIDVLYLFNAGDLGRDVATPRP